MKEITVFFDCYGVVSSEKELVNHEDDLNIFIQPQNQNGEYYSFTKLTGKCNNDNSCFGGRRFIIPIKNDNP